MSYGLTPYELVQQVYYQQEKVVLDFHPDDDKYKEVLFEANEVIQELQNVEDWSWLRERLELGPLFHDHHVIPEYDLPAWVYKPCTTFGDCVKLLHPGHEHSAIRVPWGSDGTMTMPVHYDVAPNSEPQGDRMPLVAYFFGNTITFNRPLTHHESIGRIAVCDVQRRIPLLHICTPDCPRDDKGRCRLIEDRVLTEVPDPNYVVMLTASRHASGSPAAAQRMTELNDAATRILSAMRSNDVAHTTPDQVPQQELHWLGVF